MTKFIFAVALLVGACGGSDGDDGPTLDGLWQLETSNGCVATFNFKGNKWTDNAICELESGNYGVEIESGALGRTSDTLDFVPQESSCPAHAHTSSAGYSFPAGQLALRFSNATLVFNKVSGGGKLPDGAVIANGCWDFSQSPARFTPGPVEQL